MKNKEKNPFDWENITIEKYYNIKDILDDETDDDITKNVKLVAVITDKDEDEVWNMDMAEAGEYISRLQFLNKFELPKNPNMKIKLPSYDLVVIKDLSKINVAQYVDFQNFVKMPLKESMEKILSIFLIPEGCKYNDGYDIIDLQKEITLLDDPKQDYEFAIFQLVELKNGNYSYAADTKVQNSKDDIVMATAFAAKSFSGSSGTYLLRGR